MQSRFYKNFGKRCYGFKVKTFVYFYKNLSKNRYMLVVVCHILTGSMYGGYIRVKVVLSAEQNYVLFK